MQIEKTPAGSYRIFEGSAEVIFDRNAYEDLYFAIPVDTTAFYRLLTEAVCKTDDERNRMVSMINGLSDMDSGLKDLQGKISELGE